MSEPIKNRREYLFLYDVGFANPNGDPNDENKPRIDEETGRNIVTDVRLKRTIRDYLKDFEGLEIFVREIADEEGKIQDAKARAKDFIEIRDENTKEEITEISNFKEGKKISKKYIEFLKRNIKLNLINKAIDVKLFGATVPLEFKKEEIKENLKNPIKTSITITGPVQFNMGQSLHRVKLEYIKGTGAFASGAGKEQKTFREEWILPYSFIAFHGVANENSAKEIGLTDEDVEYLKKGMWEGTKNLITRSKNEQLPRLLIEIIYKEGVHSHIGELHRYVEIESEKADEKLRSTDDFVLKIERLIEVLEEEAEKIEKVLYKVDRNLRLNRKLSSEKINFEKMEI